MNYYHLNLQKRHNNKKNTINIFSTKLEYIVFLFKFVIITSTHYDTSGR